MNKRRRAGNLRLGALLLLLGSSFAAENAAQPPQPPGKIPTELELKQQLLSQSTPLPALPLMEASRLDCSPQSGLPFFLPADLAVDADETVYVSDNSGHAILFGSLARLQFKRLETRRLQWPNSIDTWREEIFVKDNDGINVFGKDGSLHRRIRSFLGTFDLALGESGQIYINPIFPDDHSEHPVVLELDSDGGRRQDFGSVGISDDFGGLEARARIGVWQGRIFAAFRHSPRLLIFDHHGEVLGDVEVAHPIFAELAKVQEDSRFTHPREGVVALPRFLAAVSGLGSRVFLLLHLPQVEIVEYDLLGREQARYRFPSGSAVDYFGFDAAMRGDALVFAVGSVEQTRNLVIRVLQPAMSRKGGV